MNRLLRYIGCIVLISIALEYGQSQAEDTESPSQHKSFYDAMRDILQFVYKTQKNQDQFNFDKYQIKTNTTVLSCDAFLSEIIISGFSSFDYKFIQEGPSTGSKTYNFSLATSYDQLRFIFNNYKLNLDILTMISLYGEGRAGILLENVTSILNITLEEGKDGFLSVEDFSMDFNLPKIQTSLSGLLNTEAQSDMISSVLSDILPKVVKDIKPWILLPINSLASYEINQYLSANKMTIQSIIKFIESYVG